MSFNRKSTRVEHALKRYYLDGAETDEIAEELGVSRRTVQRYLNEPESEGVARALAERSAVLRLEIAHDLLQRLEELDALEEDALQARRTIVTRWELQDVEGNVVAPEDLHGEGPRTTLPKPVPVEYAEVPHISKDVERIWREQSRVTDAIVDLLGLNAPDRYAVSSEHREVHGEVLRIETDGE